MLTFSEYLQEMRMLRKLKEDALVNGEVGDSSVISPSNSNVADLDVVKPAAVPMSDCSVLGKADLNGNGGFLGKNDFFISKNVLSGNVEVFRRIPKRK